MGTTRQIVRERWSSIWERLTGTLWFVPGVIVILAVAFAIGIIELSRVLDPIAEDRFPRFFFGATAESARNILSTISGSIVTVAGVTFSIMVVAVSQASSQYTPRVLRNFMRDRLTQVTLGAMIGVFVYCLIVLRTVRDDGADAFIPELAVLGALLFALIAVALLMYFIHHIASTLEVGSILASVAADTCASASRLFSESIGKAPVDGGEEGPAAVQSECERWYTVPASCTGYIQHLDAESLLQWSIEKNCVVRMELAVGDFAIKGLPLVSVSNLRLNSEECRELNNLFVLQTYRTVYQDVGFGIRQIVDIALKALSPGVNDVTTAISAIHHLTAVLVHIAARQLPDSHWSDGHRVRVIAKAASFEALLDDAFHEIRRSGTQNPRVLSELTKALHLIGQTTHSRSRRRALLVHLALVRHVASSASASPEDCAWLLSLCERTQTALQKEKHE